MAKTKLSTSVLVARGSSKHVTETNSVHGWPGNGRRDSRLVFVDYVMEQRADMNGNLICNRSMLRRALER
jgi:hypothetical protein